VMAQRVEPSMEAYNAKSDRGQIIRLERLLLRLERRPIFI
jgi:hypothetical protein